MDLSAYEDADADALRNIRKVTENVLSNIRGIKFGSELPRKAVIVMRDQKDVVPPNFGHILELLRKSHRAVISFGEPL